MNFKSNNQEIFGMLSIILNPWLIPEKTKNEPHEIN